MVLKDNLKNMVKIKSTANSTSSLVVSATEESFGIALEGTQDQYHPSCFLIEKNSEEYMAFGKFFQSCANHNKASILIDEEIDIEHATILCFSSTKKGIYLRFGNEKQYLPKVMHFPENKKTQLTSFYSELYLELHNLKHSKEQEIIFERA